MAAIKDLLIYLLRNYPHKGELSNARVTKMIYLADWKSAVDRSCQITDIDWYFDNYGPFVTDVKKEIEGNPDLFSIEHTETMYGDRKRLFSVKADVELQNDLSDPVVGILKHVIMATKDLNWDQFIKLIYSTYPIISSDRYSSLNLVEKAREYVGASE